MKKILFVAAALMLVCAPLVRAQMKLDVDGLKAKAAKSDADIANAKKSAKAAVWLDRGKTMVDIADAPTLGAYAGMEERSADMMFGKGQVRTEKIGDKSYRVKDYPNITTYMVKEGEVNKVQFWMSGTEIIPDPLGKATEAYMKAYSLDAGSAGKVRDGQKAVGNKYKEMANNYISLQKYSEAADMLAKAFDMQQAAPLSEIDTLVGFNAGFLYTAANNFTEGEKYLTKVLEYNWDEEGDVYFYLYHCYFGQKNTEKAKAILLQGLAKYPGNSRIVEGLLAIYTSGDGDPKEVIPLVETAIRNDPKNAGLYSGLGLVQDKLGNVDESIAAFSQAAELSPKDYSASFNLGLLYIKKGDKLNADFSKKVYPTREEYDAALADVNKVYAQAITPLEKALSIKEGDPSAIELLKNLSFRLRDEPGIMDKYNKYNELFKALPAEAPAAAPAAE